MAKRHKLHRRYGHSQARYGHSMANIEAVPGEVRKLMKDHPFLTAAAIGGTAAALTAGLTGEAAMLAGAAAGLAIVKATEKG